MEVDVNCPQCGGPMVPTGATTADLIFDGPSKQGVNAASAHKHAHDVRRKNSELGLIYKCVACDYAMRYKPAPDPANTGEAPQPLTRYEPIPEVKSAPL